MSTGTGHLPFLMADYFNNGNNESNNNKKMNIIGIDPSEKMLDVAHYKLKRRIIREKYNDKIALTFLNHNSNTFDNNIGDDIHSTVNHHNRGCNIEACSESQSNSILDHSTNYCNIHDLYCNDKECQPHSNLHYTEEFIKCNQHKHITTI